MIKIKRVYEKPTKEDNFRILVNRLGPRGLTKEKAKIDLWLKEIAPSNELRNGLLRNKSFLSSITAFAKSLKRD